MKKIVVLVFYLFAVFSLSAQTFYAVTFTNSSSTQYIAGDTVTITGSFSNSVSSSNCLANGTFYYIPGINGNSIRFKFSSPVASLRSHIGLNAGDTTSIKINGLNYVVSNCDISAFSGTCSYFTTITVAGGNLINTSSISIQGALGLLDIHPPHSIDSIEITSSSAGSGFDMYFSKSCYGDVKASSDTPCAGYTLHLYATDSNLSGGPVTYSWSGPNGFTSSLKNPVINNVSSAAAGVYHLILIDDSCTYTACTTVIVDSTPALSLGSNSPLCAGDSLHLTSSSSLSSVGWLWHGPNNFSDTNQNTSRINMAVADSGYYSVSTSLNGCSAKDSVHVTVKPLPIVPIAGSNSPICAGSTLHFTISNPQSGVSYHWTGPNNYDSSMQSPSRPNIIAIDSGFYTVVANLTNCISSASVAVSVNPLPQQPLVSSNSPVCAGDSLHLAVNNLQLGINYGWTGPGPFSVTTSYFTIYNSSTANGGTYYLSAALNGCYVYDTVNAVVNPVPVVPSITSNSPLCAGNSLLLSISNVQSGVTYHWTGPGSFVSSHHDTGINNMQSVNAGYYTIKATLGTCSIKDSVQVIVDPHAAGLSAGSNSPVCAGDTLYLHANSSSSGVGYSWSGPSFGAGSANTQINNVQLSNAGTYTIVFSLNACSDTLTVPVTINPNTGPPLVTISVLPGDTVCAGTNLTFSAVTSNAGSPSYTWMRNGTVINGTTTASFTTAFVGNGDVISCKVNSILVCQSTDTALSNSIHLDIISIPPPVVSVSNSPLTYTLGDYVTFTGHPPGSPAGLTYAWTKNGVFINGNTTTTFTSNNVSQTDLVCFIVYSPVACTTPDSGIACAGTTEVGNVQAASGSVQIYPNPVNESLTIEMSGGTGSNSFAVKIFDITGRPVYNGVMNASKMQIDTRAFVKGTYILELEGADGARVIKKIVK